MDDETLKDLLGRTPLAETKRKYRSKSQIHSALQEFLDEADTILDEKYARMEGFPLIFPLLSAFNALNQMSFNQLWLV